MSQSSSNAWDVFTIAAMMAIAAAVIGSSAPLQSSRPRPGMLDADPGALSDVERIPALLTRDPFDVSTLVTPQAQNAEEDKEQKRRRDAVLQGMSVVPVGELAKNIAELLPAQHGLCSRHQGCPGVSGTIRVRVLLNLLPGDGYAESTEARRRSRYAVASALHASGYMAKSPSRIGLVCMGQNCCGVPGSVPRTDFCDLTASFEMFERSRHYGAVMEERCPRCAHRCALDGACCVISATGSRSTFDPEVPGCLRDEGECSSAALPARQRDGDPPRPSDECLGTPHECELGEKCCRASRAWKPAIADVVLVIWAREDKMLKDKPRGADVCFLPCVSVCTHGTSTCSDRMKPSESTHTHPYADAVRRLKRAILQSTECGIRPRCTTDDTVQMVLVGPRSSASIQKLLTTDTDPDLVVISPTATASFEALDQLQKWSSGLGLIRSERVLSVIANDPVLTTSIVNELARRGILSHVRLKDNRLIAGRSPPVGAMTQHRVLMLGESDHSYVRLLRWEYATAFERHLCPKVEAIAKERRCVDVQELVGRVIYHYDYFRQIDTEEATPSQPQAATTSTSGLGGLSATMSSPTSAQIERPEGRSQIDYIRRIIDSAKRRLADEPHGTQIVAVGVIATDPYDKLLILQAVRKAFPHAVFFVHDVDARLLHPRELPFTRNTIIAASFGLDPDETLPGNRRRVGISAPTMRDSHQSAIYVATHHAVTQCNDCLLKTFPPFHSAPLGLVAQQLSPSARTEVDACDPGTVLAGKQPKCILPQARIYEIGREGIVRLDPVSAPTITSPTVAIGWVTAVLLAALALCELHRFWSIRPRTFASMHKRSLATWFRRRCLIFAVGGLGAVGLLVVLRYEYFWSSEPVGLTKGMSSWPVIFLYALAAYSGLVVLLSVHARAKMIRLDLGDATSRAKPIHLAKKCKWFFCAATKRRWIPDPEPEHWLLKDDAPGSFWRRLCVMFGLWPALPPAVRDIHGWAHPPLKGTTKDMARFWHAVQSALSRRTIALATAIKFLAFCPIVVVILLAFGPEPDGFRWARDSVRVFVETLWLIAFISFVLAVFAFREVANVIIRVVSHLRWNRSICPSRSITQLNAPSGPPEVRAVLVRARMIEDLATEVARLAVLLLFVLLPMIVSQSKVFERMVFSPMVMILLLIPSLLWLAPLAILQSRVRLSRGELVEELLEIKRGFLQTNPPLGASDPSVASVDTAIRSVEAGGGPMAKPLLLGPFAKLLIPVIGGLALLAMHVLWGPY